MADLSQLPIEELMRLREQMAPAPVQPEQEQQAMPDIGSMPIEQLMALRDQMQPQSSPAAPQPPPGLPASSVGARQGLTANFGDEIMAGLTTPIEMAVGAYKGTDAGKGVGQRISDAYGRGLEQERALQKRAQAESPIAYGAGSVGGSLVSAGQLMKGGATLLKGGQGFGQTVARGAGEGALYGAASGAGEGEGIKDRAYRAVEGGGVGAVAGGALGAVSGASAPAIPGVSRPSAAMLADDMRAAGGEQAVRQRLADIGPNGMLLDASPSFQGRAQGLAIQPETREAVTAPLISRNQATNQRLGADINASLGVTPVPSQVEAGLAASRQQVGEAYGPLFRNARAVDTSRLADTLDTMVVDLRGPAQEAVRRARGYLNIAGTQQLDPNPGALFQTRQALDGLMEGEANTKVLSQLSFARQAVDDQLRAAVPGIKQVDARFAELARQSEGLRRGSQVLDGGKTAVRPVELADEIGRAITPQGETVGPSGAAYRMRQGTRAEIDRLVGTRGNDLEALKQAVKGEGDWNRAKLSQLFGEQEAGRVFNAVDREAAFRDAYKKIVENSQTAQRTASAEATKPRGASQPSGNSAMLATILGGPQGAALALGAGGVKAAGGAALRSSDIARNKELARILTMSASDPQAQNLLSGLSRLSDPRKTDLLVQLLTQQSGQRVPEATGMRLPR